jgi:L-ascorbate metabolism protein UlaG (beta-lactamase superfamily)
MKITKYAHACLLIEEGNCKVIVDPGRYNKTPDAMNVDAVLINT